ncbi:Hsp20 family protein [Acidiferrimicrobium sp. IK]|uniref:Hsp20/alpha crystallin family protein n=1 Tax=Acidiferrimicrobium sp. IK TaxID=2871700 RepID=UPI0021CB6214|nr:HSP20 family small heat-shock protein [Acidiferrimicrobium sp. IK]MCU4185115.1 Hsp20 family protein [Acidiferrimicrobium sp. IK]
MLLRTDTFRDLDRLTQQVFGTPARPSAMPLDAYRSGDRFVVEMDLPGMAPDAIDVTVEHDVLTVKATRIRHNENTQSLIEERPYGSFERRVFLADGLDTEHIAASYTDGVLRLELPVAEQAKARRIEINAGKAPVAIDA